MREIKNGLVFEYDYSRENTNSLYGYIKIYPVLNLIDKNEFGKKVPVRGYLKTFPIMEDEFKIDNLMDSEYDISKIRKSFIKNIDDVIRKSYVCISNTSILTYKICIDYNHDYFESIIDYDYGNGIIKITSVLDENTFIIANMTSYKFNKLKLQKKNNNGTYYEQPVEGDYIIILD